MIHLRIFAKAKDVFMILFSLDDQDKTIKIPVGIKIMNKINYLDVGDSMYV